MKEEKTELIENELLVNDKYSNLKIIFYPQFQRRK